MKHFVAPHYRIVYSDGDEEDMTEEMVASLRVLSQDQDDGDVVSESDSNLKTPTRNVSSFEKGQRIPIGTIVEKVRCTMH